MIQCEMAPIGTDDRLIDTRDVALLVKVRPKTLRRLAKAGDFPAPRRFGRRYRWLASEIQTYLRTLPMA